MKNVSLAEKELIQQQQLLVAEELPCAMFQHGITKAYEIMSHFMDALFIKKVEEETSICLPCKPELMKPNVELETCGF